jgi:hypothetical protein
MPNQALSRGRQTRWATVQEGFRPGDRPGMYPTPCATGGRFALKLASPSPGLPVHGLWGAREPSPGQSGPTAFTAPVLGGEGFHPPELPIGPLRRFWALAEERIILGRALVAHLRKRIDAQRLGLSTCKAGALPTELRPHTLMSIAMYHQNRKNTPVTRF